MQQELDLLLEEREGRQKEFTFINVTPTQSIDTWFAAVEDKLKLLDGRI